MADLVSRLRAAFTGRRDEVDVAVPDRAPEPQQERWLYLPSISDSGWQQIRVVDATGYDFARLTWKICQQCELGLVAKIRVTDGWQRRGYATRMLVRAMRGCESYSRTTSAAFTANARQCQHMRAAPGGGHGPARQEERPPLRPV
ncbi:hypothetical protein ACIRST_02110 [Kitasatospora sp. NPDC101447]|uniref:hypothetical protein n=1 Tax=Kitasatospora sp. NPDC101447 TaxID=3364102 RepID=UPI003803E6C7